MPYHSLVPNLILQALITRHADLWSLPISLLHSHLAILLLLSTGGFRGARNSTPSTVNISQYI